MPHQHKNGNVPATLPRRAALPSPDPRARCWLLMHVQSVLIGPYLVDSVPPVGTEVLPVVEVAVLPPVSEAPPVPYTVAQVPPVCGAPPVPYLTPPVPAVAPVLLLPPVIVIGCPVSIPPVAPAFVCPPVG